MRSRGRCLALIGLFAFVLVLVSPVKGRGVEEDRAVIEKTIRNSIGWALEKDRALLESVLSHDADFFIFHPDSKSTVVGWDAFVKLFDVWMDPRFKATHFDVRDLRINFSRGEDVAWFSSILDDCGEWDGKPNCWKDTRWTGVLEKRDGKWIIVQMHFSFAEDMVRAETDSTAKVEQASWEGAPLQEPSFGIEDWEKRLNKRQPPLKIVDAIGAAHRPADEVRLLQPGELLLGDHPLPHLAVKQSQQLFGRGPLNQAALVDDDYVGRRGLHV